MSVAIATELFMKTATVGFIKQEEKRNLREMKLHLRISEKKF